MYIYIHIRIYIYIYIHTYTPMCLEDIHYIYMVLSSVGSISISITIACLFYCVYCLLCIVYCVLFVAGKHNNMV